MYCIDHVAMMRCNSFEKSNCTVCGLEMWTANAPPVDKVCSDCSERYGVCRFCGEGVSLHHPTPPITD